MMIARTVTVGFVVAAMATMALGTNLNGDPAALISGAADFSSPDDFAAAVEYAVYAPGDYAGVFAGSDEYFIYAYQVFNDPGSAGWLASFTVGLLEGAGVVGYGFDDTYGVLGGEEPLLTRLVGGANPTSVEWVLDEMASDVHSTVLLFSSPFTYTWDTGSIINQGGQDTQPLPTPIPEPATMALLGLGAVALVARRRRG